MTLFCKKCFIGIEAENYQDFLEKALRAIPDRELASEDLRQRRAALCEACEYFTAATCRACGCYVELRAARRASRCPYKKW